MSCGKAPRAPIQKHSELATRIESVLPKNWSLEESNGQIIISRREPITSYGCIGLALNLISHPDLLKADVEKNGVAQGYRIRLRIAPKMSLEEYARLKDSNSQIKVGKGTNFPTREFYEDEAMQSFDPRYRELPEYYDKDSSIYLETTLAPTECVYPDDVARECEKVRQTFDSFLTRYPGGWGPRPLSRTGN